MTVLAKPDALNLVGRVLEAFGWRNDPNVIAEAFPYLRDDLHADEIIECLDKLRIPYSLKGKRERAICSEDCPVLVLPSHGKAYLAIGRNENGLIVETGPSASTVGSRVIEPTRQKCRLLMLERVHHRKAEQKASTVDAAFSAMVPFSPWLILASFICNVLGLVAPLLIMAIYDWVIPTGSKQLLLALAIGVTIAAATDFAFRHARSRVLAYVGAQGERALALALFRKLMHVPPRNLINVQASQLIARFRQLECFREIFSGQVTTTILDLPFTIISLVVLFLIAPSVAMMTFSVALLLIAIGAFTVIRQSQLDLVAADASAAAAPLVEDAIQHQRAISELGMTTRWMERSIDANERADTAAFAAKRFQAFSQVLTQTILLLATTGAVLLGTIGAMNETMSFGALIATIVLVSKVLSPINALQGSFGQIMVFLQSRRQADRVFSLTEEHELGLETSQQNKLGGAITFQGVTHRPDPGNQPVLSQVSFELLPKETVLIMSDNIAARLAVLDLVDGLFQPIVGTIEHEEIDVRQIARDELRRSMTYAQFKTEFFYGTVAQNLRLCAPTASGDDIQDVLRRMNLLANDVGFSDGAETRLKSKEVTNMRASTSRALVLARSFISETPISLFAEPTTNLEDNQRAAFKSWLQEKQGTKSILISSSDKSLIPYADRFLFFSGNRLAVNATGEDGKKKLMAAFKSVGV
ncbi:MAG: ABC transporter transmembrane domain-containing protein [Pseudomonadota bacterium]